MAYNIVYKKSVHRDLKALSKAEARRVLDRIERELSKNRMCVLFSRGSLRDSENIESVIIESFMRLREKMY